MEFDRKRIFGQVKVYITIMLKDSECEFEYADTFTCYQEDTERLLFNFIIKYHQVVHNTSINLSILTQKQYNDCDLFALQQHSKKLFGRTFQFMVQPLYDDDHQKNTKIDYLIKIIEKQKHLLGISYKQRQQLEIELMRQQSEKIQVERSQCVE